MRTTFNSLTLTTGAGIQRAAERLADLQGTVSSGRRVNTPSDDPSGAAQMVRVRLAVEADCVPEISANKYALNIRFVTAGADPRPRTCERDVDFELTFCSL